MYLLQIAWYYFALYVRTYIIKGMSIVFPGPRSIKKKNGFDIDFLISLLEVTVTKDGRYIMHMNKHILLLSNIFC